MSKTKTTSIKPDEIAIRVSNVSKTFKLPHEKHNSIKSLFINVFRNKRTYEKQQVLKNVSFEIKKGEFFGIVGRNGSGKSTLLKLLSGIYTPDKGHIEVNGKLVPFIELGVGFNPDLTGRENVFLNGALLGFSRKEMKKMYDEIVDFAELEKFMDQKLKNYSSGMQVRLAFSIAIRAKAEILVLDEVLAVGDEAFQRKCFEYFAQLKSDKRTVILVTHSMDSVQSFCTSAMYIEGGKIKLIGNTGQVTRAYEEANKPTATESTKLKASSKKKVASKMDLTIALKNQHGREGGVLRPEDSLVFEIAISSKKDVTDILLALEIQRASGQKVYRIATEAPNATLGVIRASTPKRIRLEVENIFAEDAYEVNVYVRSIDRSIDYISEIGILGFSILTDARRGKWSLRPRHDLQIDPEA